MSEVVAQCWPLCLPFVALWDSTPARCRNKAFLMQVSALAHREPARSHSWGNGSPLLLGSILGRALSLTSVLSATCSYCPANINVLCICCSQGTSFMESRASPNFWCGLTLVAVLPHDVNIGCKGVVPVCVSSAKRWQLFVDPSCYKGAYPSCWGTWDGSVGGLG